MMQTWKYPWLLTYIGSEVLSKPIHNCGCMLAEVTTNSIYVCGHFYIYVTEFEKTRFPSTIINIQKYRF